jgi:hypothetical protein
MNRTHIRSYAITGAGDVAVCSYRKGDRIDISEHYAEHAHPQRRDMRLEAHLDIFRYDDGKLYWSGSPNGHDVQGALTFDFLLGLFLEDVDLEDGTPRVL